MEITSFMKKFISIVAVAFVALFCMSSCSEEALDVDSANKQTILVFMPWTGDNSSQGLTRYLKANLDSISDGIIDKKGLTNSRLMVFFSDNANSSTLYEFQYDAVEKKVNRVPVKTYEGAFYNSAEGFASLLGDVKQHAEALNYALIVGGHGCGWTYADDWNSYPYNAKPHSVSMGTDWSSAAKSNGLFSSSSDAPHFSGIYFGSDRNSPLTRFFGSVSLQSHAMDVATLAAGIKTSGIKMQYILFDVCYMANVETAYELKEATNYMIATGSEMLAAGIPYRSIWSYLNSPTPNYSGIVSTTVNFYKNSSAPYCNMSAVDCRQLDNLASVMKEINGKYQLDSSLKLDSIQPLGGFQPNLFYDLGVYVDSLHPSGYIKEQFTTQLKATVKAESHTDAVITALGLTESEVIKVKSYSGLSISDPSTHPVAVKGREKTGWWKATH